MNYYFASSAEPCEVFFDPCELRRPFLSTLDRMSEPIVVNQSTSVVQVDTSTVVYPKSAVVLLSTLTAPGTIITIRDITGYASTNRGIAVSTTSGVHYLDGPGCNVYNINQPYGFLTVTPRTSNVWAVINTFAFPDQAAHPSVEGIDVRQGNFSNLSGNTGSFNNLTVFYSTFMNVATVSSVLAMSISTQSLGVTSTLSVVNLSTSSARISSLAINNPLTTSTLLEVNGSMRASTIFLTNSAFVRGSLVYNTNNIVSTVQGLGTATYVSTTSLVSTVQGLGTATYVSTTSLVSTVQGLGTATYVSTPSLVSTVQGLGTATYVSTTSLVSTVQGLGTAGYLSSPIIGLISTVIGLGSSGYVSTTMMASTVQGLGSSGFVSSTALVSTVQGLGTASYMSSASLVSTVQGLGTATYVSTASLVSTVQGLGTATYVSTASLVSTVQGLGTANYVSSASLVSTVQGLGTATYVSTASLVSTVQGLGSSGYISSPHVVISSLSTHSLTVYGPSTFINASNIFIGASLSTNTMRFIGTYKDGFGEATQYTNTVIAERIYDEGLLTEESSELLLFKGNDGTLPVTFGPGPDRVRVLAVGGFRVDIASNGGIWPVGGQPPSTAIRAFTINCNGFVGIGCNTPSYTLDVAGTINASNIGINGSFLVTTSNLVSTVQGAGTAGYVSSVSLVSTVQGLGTANYVSSASLVSTVQGLGTANYVSSASLVSTVQGLGTANYVSSGSLASTVQGLGSAGYISSPNVSISSLSTNSLTVYGPSTFINASNMFLGASVSTNVLRFLGTAGDSDQLYTNTVIGERIYDGAVGSAGQSSELILFKGNDAANPFGPDRVRVLSPGGFQVDISTETSWPIGGQPPSTALQAFYIGCNGRVGINCNSPSYTLDVNGSINASGTINARGFVNSDNLVSTVQGLGTTSYISTTSLVSTVQGLGTAGYMSSVKNELASTVQGLGTSSYISSTGLVSTVQGLGTSSYISSTSLVSTVQGLGSSGYISSPNVGISSLSTHSLTVYGPSTFINASNMFLGASVSTNVLRFLGTAGDSDQPYTNTVIGERIYDGLAGSAGQSSELILFKGNDAANPFGPDRVRVLSPGGFQVDISTESSWPIGGQPPSTALQAFYIGCNGYVGINCNSPSYTLDINGSMNVSGMINARGFVNSENLTSTVKGLGNSSYVSSTGLASTVQGLGTSSYISSTGLVSTVQGLGTGGYLSSVGAVMVSTVQGLGTAGYLSSIGAVMVSTVQGLGAVGYLSSPAVAGFVSTVQGLGSSRYISSPIVSLSTLSTQSLIAFGESTFLFSSNVYIGNSLSTNILRFYGTTAYNSFGVNQYARTVIAERSFSNDISELLLFKANNPQGILGPDNVRVLAAGGFQVDIASNGGVWPINGNPPSAVIQAFTVNSNGYVGINCNSPRSTLDINGIVNVSSNIYVNGLPVVTFGNGLSSNYVATSNFLIGASPSTNTLRFLGTNYDAFNEGDTRRFTHSVIGERIYAPDELSELLIFKGDNTGSNSWGPDRVRVLSAGGFVVDIAPEGSIWPLNMEPPPPLISNALSIGRDGVIRTASTILVNGSRVITSGGAGGSIVLSSNVGINCNTPVYTLDVAGIINASSNIIAGGTISATCNMYVNGNPVVTSGGAGGTIVLSCNVGINCNTPAYTLDVAGIINASCNMYVNGNRVITSGGAGGAIVLSCNVGINCNTPAYSLDVNGCVNVSGCNVAANQWVALGTGADKILKSSDGYVWSAASGATFSTRGNRVAWNGSNQWIAVGSGGYAVLRSTDGNSWTPSPGGITFTEGNDVVWNGSNLWVVVGNGNAGNSILYSANGTSWTASSTGFSSGGFGVATSGSYWIAVGNGGSTAANQKYSTDGITWTNASVGGFGGSSGGRGVAYNGSNMWVAVGYGSSAANTILYSISGGQLWNNAVTGGFSGYGASVTWNGSLWVATGSHSSAAGNIQISLDGMNWVPSLSGAFSGSGSGVVWSGTKFIATGTGTSPILYSDDGRNWSSCNVSNASFTAGGGIGYGRTLTGPLYALTVSGDTYINGTLYINGLPAGAAAGGSGGSGGGGGGGGGSTLPINIELVSSLVGLFGSVGVGCNAPSYSLDVNGTINASSNVFINGSPLLAASSLYSTVRGLGSGGYVSTTQMNALMSNTIVSTVRGLGVSGYVSTFSLTSTIQGLGTAGYVSSLGNLTNLTNVSSLQGVFSSIGVNCNAPAHTLDVNGNIQTSARLWVNSTGDFTVGPRDSSSTRGLLRIVTQDGASFIQSGSNATSGGVAPLHFTQLNGYPENSVMTINMSNGRVGIGCNAPAYPLDVVGSMRISRANNYDRMTFGFSPVQSPSSHNWPLISMLVGNANAYLWGDSVYQTPGLLIGYNVHTENGAMVVDSVNNFGGAMIEVGLQRGAATYGGINFVVSHLGTAAAFSNASANPAISINSYRGSTPGNYTYINGDLYVGGSNSSNMIRFAGTYGDGFYSTPEYSHTVIAERIYASTESSELLLFKGNGDGVTSGATDLDRVRVLSVGGFKVDIANYAAAWAVGGEPPGIKIDALNIDSSGVTSIRSLVAGAITCTGHSAWIWGPGYSPTVSIGYSTVQASSYHLDISGNVRVTGSISKGSGSFTIDHPVVPSTILVHSFIEGPRCDLIYRNRKQLSNGYAEIDIEKECTANDSTMTPGTFEALCTNPQTFLQNNETFDRVKGYVSSHMLFITCENPESTAMIDWQVIAERHDPFIKKWNMTDSNGLLILEHPKLV